MREHLPSYYRKSRVMNELMDSLESEHELLKQEVQLTENQFFVLLCDKDIAKYEADVGISSDPSAELETRRGRIFSRLRGTGTVTKTMMKNVAASFVNGEIEIIEYASEYMFAVKFMSKQGVPYNLSDMPTLFILHVVVYGNVNFVLYQSLSRFSNVTWTLNHVSNKLLKCMV